MVRGAASRALAAVLLVATTLLLAGDDASAHVPHDDITQVIASPSYATDRTFFAVSRDRLLRSTNAGASWTEIVWGIDRHRPTRLAIAPSDEQIMYLSNLGGGVYRSRDQGWSWEPTTTLTAMQNIADLTVAPESPDVVFAAGTSAGLFRTLDGGESWTPVGSFGRVTAVVFADSSGRVIAGDSNGAVFVSDDEGSTWVQSSGTVAGDMITAIATAPAPTSPATVFVGTRSGRLFRSVNRGTSFSEVGSGLPDDQITSIGISNTYPTDGTVWVSAWNKGVYRSTNRGATFSVKSVGLTTDPQAATEGVPQFGGLTVAVGAGGQRVLFVAGFDGLFKSDDLGNRWREVQTLTEYVVGLAVSPDYDDDATVIATTYVKGAYLSNDAGATWKGRHVGLGSPPSTKFAPVNRLHNVQFSPNYANDGTIFSATWTNLLKSTDRGESWTTIPVGTIPPGTQRQFVIAPSPSYASDRAVYVGTRQGEIYRSTAGGEANTWVRLGNLGSRVRSLVLVPDFPAEPVLYASTVQGIHKSVDAGFHWQRTGGSGISMLAISPDYGIDGTVFAGTDQGVFVTRNEGQSWTELTAPPLSTSTHVEGIGVSPNYAADQTVLVSVLGKGLFRSSDGGATFVEIATPLIENNHLIADFANPTSAPIQFSRSFALDHTIYAIAQQHIVKSTDGGDTWEVVELPPAAALLKPPVIAAATTPGRVLEGANGEQHTIKVAFDLSHPYAADVTVQWQTIDVPSDATFASSAAGDYRAASGTLVFPKGSTCQFVSVVVNGDSLEESDETLMIGTRNATNATIGGFWGLGLGVIEDDDAPVIVPGAASVVEGDAGSSVLAIPVSLSAVSGRTVTVDWATLDHEAVGGQDFAPSSGTLTFLPGQTTNTIEVAVYGDTSVELDEWLLVATSNPTNANLGGFWGLGLGRILNDDEPG